ncbi:MAG: hypothetical protein FJX75_16530 [Armatimonadetes bacterium]|nr:hypothetical protein [Armatimonadota bacterium]
MRRHVSAPTRLLSCLALLVSLPTAGPAQNKTYGPKKPDAETPATPPTAPATTATAPGQCPKCQEAVAPSDAQIICPHCGVPLIAMPGQGGERVLAPGLRLKPFVYMDTQGTGLELFRMTTPVGWDFQGGVRWDLSNPGMPATVAGVVANPAGPQALEIFPNINFVWKNDPLSAMLQPIGSKSLGAEVRPPMDALEMLKKVALPRYRRPAQNLRITTEQHLPDLPKQILAKPPEPGTQFDGAKVRFEYDWQGQKLEEEMYGMVMVARLPMASAFGQAETVVWMALYLFSARAPAGQLDPAADLFRTVASSTRVNPAWSALYEQITVALCQNQIRNIRQIGEIGRAYAQQGSEIRDDNLRSWYQRQEIKDGIMDNVSRTIRGVDAYYDPHKGETVELPGGYGHAWANNLGEYIVTESTDFNPNIGSNLHWEPMEAR